MKKRQLKKIKKNIFLRIPRKDNLTGVYNKKYFCNYIKWKSNGTIIRVEIDGINFININYGVEKGNKIIKFIAKNLSYKCKDMILARLSNFAFAIYTPDVNEVYIKNFMNNIMATLLDKVENKYKIYIQFNIAAVIYKDKDLNIEDATSKLEVCMSSLSKKRSGFEIYNERYDDYISIKSIEEAIKKEEIQLYYQPKVDLQSGEIVGVEALIRWFSFEHGYINPEKLIAFSEEYGYINILGKWILEKACEDIKYLNEILNTEIDLSVNISPNQLDNEFFNKDLINSINKINFKFNLLKLELTESENIEDIIKINDIINEIKSTGIKISIDDFGKGFNSINYIKNYNVDEIKIDKSLVEYMNVNPMFIKNLIKMIHTTKTKVVAEGVEAESEYLMLKNIKCDLVQGYYCYKPMSLNELIDVVGKGKYKSMTN